MHEFVLSLKACMTAMDDSIGEVVELYKEHGSVFLHNLIEFHR